TIQRINIIGSREGSRNRRRLKANQTGKKFRVGIKSNISTNRNNLISGVDRCIHLRSEERFSRNAETDLVCRLLLEKKKKKKQSQYRQDPSWSMTSSRSAPAAAGRCRSAPA